MHFYASTHDLSRLEKSEIDLHATGINTPKQLLGSYIYSDLPSQLKSITAVPHDSNLQEVAL